MPKVLTHKLRVQISRRGIQIRCGALRAWQTLGHKARGSRGVQKKARKIIDDRLGPVKRA